MRDESLRGSLLGAGRSGRRGAGHAAAAAVRSCTAARDGTSQSAHDSARFWEDTHIRCRRTED